MNEEIENLLHTYQRGLNEANLDLVRSVYTNDAVVIGQPFPTATGIEAIIALYADFLSKLDFNVQFDLLEMELINGLGFIRTRSPGRLCPRARNRPAVKATAKFLSSRRFKVRGSSIVTFSTPR